MSSEMDPNTLGPPGTGPDTAAIPQLSSPAAGETRRPLADGHTPTANASSSTEPTASAQNAAGVSGDNSSPAGSSPASSAAGDSGAWGPAPEPHKAETRRHLGIAVVAITAAVAVAVGLALITNAIGAPVSKNSPVTVAEPTATAVPVTPTLSEPSTPETSTSPSESAGTVKFTSPSGNINCTLSPDQVRCDLKSQSWSTKKPKDCRTSKKLGALLTAKSAKIVCDDHQYGGQKLNYGETISLGEFTCESTKVAVKCTHSEGRRFRVAHDWVKFNSKA